MISQQEFVPWVPTEIPRTYVTRTKPVTTRIRESMPVRNLEAGRLLSCLRLCRPSMLHAWADNRFRHAIDRTVNKS